MKSHRDKAYVATLEWGDTRHEVDKNMKGWTEMSKGGQRCQKKTQVLNLPKFWLRQSGDLAKKTYWGLFKKWTLFATPLRQF